jgi:hypothetical protein
MIGRKARRAGLFQTFLWPRRRAVGGMTSRDVVSRRGEMRRTE